MDACFVCLETSPPLIQPCKCSSWVHPTCFATMMERVSSHATGCPVCTQPYSVQLHLRHVCYTLEYNRTFVCILLFAPSQLAFGASVSVFVARVGGWPLHTLAWVAGVAIAMWAAILTYSVRHHGWPMVQWVRRERYSPTAGRCTHSVALVECVRRRGVEPSASTLTDATDAHAAI